MATSRYSRIGFVSGGFGTQTQIIEIRKQIASGVIPCKEYYLTGNQRLDTIAGIEYGDSLYWWVIAAASDIGWGMQVPPGTRIKVPNLNQILELVA